MCLNYQGKEKIMEERGKKKKKFGVQLVTTGFMCVQAI